MSSIVSKKRSVCTSVFVRLGHARSCLYLNIYTLEGYQRNQASGVQPQLYLEGIHRSITLHKDKVVVMQLGGENVGEVCVTCHHHVSCLLIVLIAQAVCKGVICARRIARLNCSVGRGE